MKKTSSPKPTYHHGDLRHALIEAGLALLQEENALAITLRKVAKRAGVSHAAPYRHFADKTALLAAIAEHGFQQLAQEMQQAIDAHPVAPRQQIIALSQRYVAFGVSHPSQLTLMFSDMLAAGQSDTLGQAAGQTYARLEEAVLAAHAAGELVGDAPDRSVKALWALVHGLAMLAKEGLLVDTSDVLADEVAQTVTLMLDGMSDNV